MATRHFPVDISSLRVPAPGGSFLLPIGPPVPPPHQQQAVVVVEMPRSWFWVWLGLAGFCVLSLVLALSVFGVEGHHDHEWEHQDKAQQQQQPDTPASCTLDEVFDTTAKLCIMQPHFPQAIAESIIDPAVSPCTDFYRHACGKWIDAHTNENRGFAGNDFFPSFSFRTLTRTHRVICCQQCSGQGRHSRRDSTQRERILQVVRGNAC
jgi:hypothetical protein